MFAKEIGWNSSEVGMKIRFAVFAAGLLLLSSIAVFAHHAFQAEYDATKPVKVTGTVKKVEWMNRTSGSTLM